MRTHHTLIALAACGAAAGALAQQQPEMGRVLSSQPVVQQVAVQQPVCSQQQVLAEGPRSGAGAVMGAIAGGALGNAIGGGSGRAAATALGLFGGAVLGDRVEGGQPQWQTVQNCGTQTSYENRTVGYDVTYEYAGQRYTTRTQSDPGAWIPVQVSAGYAPPPVPPQPAGYDVQPGIVVPQYQAVQPIAYAPAPVVVAPPPVYYGGPVYPRSYYGAPPVGLSLNFGYVHRGGHSHGPRHWR